MNANLAALGAGLSNDRLLPWTAIKDIVGISRTTVWRQQNAGAFPRPVLISPGRVGWRESEVAAWKASRAPRGVAHEEPPPLFAAARAPAAPPPTTASEVVPAALASVAVRRTSKARPREAIAGQLSFDF